MSSEIEIEIMLQIRFASIYLNQLKRNIIGISDIIIKECFDRLFTNLTNEDKRKKNEALDKLLLFYRPIPSYIYNIGNGIEGLLNNRKCICSNYQLISTLSILNEFRNLEAFCFTFNKSNIELLMDDSFLIGLGEVGVYCLKLSTYTIIFELYIDDSVFSKEKGYINNLALVFDTLAVFKFLL
jgi:hypothetical protein